MHLPTDNPIAARLLAVIEAHAKLGERALSNETYAGLLNVSLATQHRALKCLLDAGLIEMEKHGQQQHRFRAVRIDAWTQSSAKEFREPKPVTVKRPCLCCGTTFASEGPHNRLCAACRQDTALPSYSLAAFRGAHLAP